MSTKKSNGAVQCIASIDQGTSSTRVLLFTTSDGSYVGGFQTEHTQYYPHPGWLEHDPEEIWRSVQICMTKAIENVRTYLGRSASLTIKSIGITNQRETTIVWNKITGKVYHNAIVWSDMRTNHLCNELISQYGKDGFRSKTGLPITSYFSATKLMYLLNTVKGLRSDSENGDALFGTIDCWIIWKLTQGKVHATDVTNASRTLLMNIDTLQWDQDILDTFKIPLAMLPTITPSCSATLYSKANFQENPSASHSTNNTILYDYYHNVPICGVLGDQQAALFGQSCYSAGEAKCTYGTGAFLLMNTGEEMIQSTSGLLTTVAYQLNETAKPLYALEGSVAYSGSTIQWLRDNMEFFKSASESESIAKSVPDNGGVYFVPAFAGLYAPYWRNDARGIIVGLTAFNTKAHFVRAAIESTSFQCTEVLNAMQMDSKIEISSLKVDGGMISNALAMKFQSDLLNFPLHLPKITETTALGVAYMAGLGIGVWNDVDELRSLWKLSSTWTPTMSDEIRSDHMYHWRKALARTLHWTAGEMSDPEFIADPYIPFLDGPIPDESTSPEVSIAEMIESSKMNDHDEDKLIEKLRDDKIRVMNPVWNWSSFMCGMGCGVGVAIVIVTMYKRKH